MIIFPECACGSKLYRMYRTDLDLSVTYCLDCGQVVFEWGEDL